MIEERVREDNMSRATREVLWDLVKQTFNQNPQGIPLENLLDKIPIKPGFIEDNPHLIMTDHVDLLRSSGFLKVIHVTTSKNFFIRMHHPIWKIPKELTIKEALDLSKQPDWILWFKYPDGNII